MGAAGSTPIAICAPQRLQKTAPAGSATLQRGQEVTGAKGTAERPTRLLRCTPRMRTDQRPRWQRAARSDVGVQVLLGPEVRGLVEHLEVGAAGAAAEAA
jgi:hypothetical protein